MGLGLAEFALDFGAVDGVAEVVAGAVFDVGDEGAAGGAGGEGGHLLVEEVADFLDDGDVGEFVAAADVVGGAVFGFHEDAPDGGAVVFDVEPVADVQAVAIDGKGFAFEGVEDHQGDEFFGEVVGAVVVPGRCQG